MGPERVSVVFPLRPKELIRGLMTKHEGKVQRRPVSGGAEVLDERPDSARQAGNERVLARPPDAALSLEARPVPPALGIPIRPYGRDAGLGELSGSRAVPKPRQSVERVESLANVVLSEVDEWPTDMGPVEGEGD